MKIKKEEKENQEKFFNVPNIITSFRLILVFVFIYMLFNKFEIYYTLSVFIVAAATDWFDGFFARKLNQTSKFGARMDYIVDRIFTILVVSSLFIYMFLEGILEKEFSLLLMSVSREILGTPGFLIALIRKKEYYHVRYIGKVTTFVQSCALGAIILGVSWAIYFAVATCILGIISGFTYLKYSLE